MCITWIYERDGNKIYRRPFRSDYPRQLMVLNKPIYNN